MGDPATRKSLARSRLREQLKKKREALADQFDFKMYIIFHFKEKKKSCAVFEVPEVLPVMTNNYEELILKGAKDQSYSVESSVELLEKDIVQLHAPRWHSMRRDIVGCTSDVDFLIWPRNDLESVRCLLFSRWKDDDGPFRPLQMEFQFLHADYGRQLAALASSTAKTGFILNNNRQSVFLFIDRHHLETPRAKKVFFKLCSVCLYISQDQLMHWEPGSEEEVLQRYIRM